MINWSDFQKLPGSAEGNFEFLCRALIRFHYDKYGLFAALANQPGVEFHLRLEEGCKLGVAGRWFGWQCRWFDLPKGRAIGITRRKKIEEAVIKSMKALPGLTDWILWTRNTLTKGDQKWFYELKKKLKSKMRFNLWTSIEAEELLSGDAEILRRTYFGELVLTPDMLADLHRKSVAPIRARWLPEAHQAVDAERTIRRMLGEAASWDELIDVAKRLLEAVQIIRKEPLTVMGVLSVLTPLFVKAASDLADTMRDVYKLLDSGDYELLREKLDGRPKGISNEVAAAPRKMRGARLPCGLIATNALADLKHGIELLKEVANSLGVRIVAVLADAGGGKTQMAAELTSEIPSKRPAGIFMRGSELHSGRTLEDLPKCNSLTVSGIPIPSMEALFAALDAAGQRARRRLPLVIDGLNEAQFPTDWKDPLSSLSVMLDRFANILVICTVRTGARRPEEQDVGFFQESEPEARMDFAQQALPESVLRIKSPGFGGNTMEAILRYFEYFKINAEDAELPIELLGHPLTLRIFCEVTNRERKRLVSIEAIPGSLASLFQQYIEHAAIRIAELSPRDHRYFPGDVKHVIDLIGTAFWEGRTRELPIRPLRAEIGDDIRPWNRSIIHMLEQEGVILLAPGDTPHEKNMIPVYDALGGFLIANSVIATHTPASFEAWLKTPGARDAFKGTSPNAHPLASDVFEALACLVPKRHPGTQLWQIVDSSLKESALRMAADLEGRFLDAATVNALSDWVRSGKGSTRRLFVRLFHTRGGSNHPLNSDFLDSSLRAMTVANRDLCWTEWVRQNSINSFSYERQLDIPGDLRTLEIRWQSTQSTRSLSDRLRIKWLMWLLTSTIHNLRDRVTRVIYWFGRGDPAALFEIATNAADINDPYVFERMLAASYGVAMACHCDPGNSDFRKTVLPDFARKIFDLLFRVDAPARTTHVLTREYGSRIIELAISHNRKLFSKAEAVRARPPFSDGGKFEWQDIEAEDSELHGVNSPFRMDFQNYTLGRLVADRANYDFNHAGYRKVRAQVLWRVKQLGWTPEEFQELDRMIESDRGRYYRIMDEHHKVDRYGKKYSWIAYLELDGWLRDQGCVKAHNERTWEVDIDPSFPAQTNECQLVTLDLLTSSKTSLADWIKEGDVPDIKQVLRRSSVNNEAGPWIALDGFVVQQNDSTGRRLFAFLRTFFVAKREASKFAASLAGQHLGGRWLPEKPEAHHTFAGEVPWCAAYARNDLTEMQFVIKERKVKVKRRCRAAFLDGKKLSLARILRWQLNELAPDAIKAKLGEGLTEDELKRVIVKNTFEEAEEIRPDYRKFRVSIPVVDFDWEGRTVENVSMHGIVLEKQIAKSCGLVNLPQTCDLQTKDGVRATYGVAWRAGDFHNNERFFFIREEVLRAYLKKRGLAMVWAVWGERELSSKQMGRDPLPVNREDFSKADFQTVIRFT